MAEILQFIFFVLASLSFCVTSNQVAEPYVVYMGSTLQGGDHETLQAAHLQMLSSVIPSGEEERVSLMQSYHYAFKGFSAMLTETEAALLSGYDEVVSVFPDQMLQLHTTRSWDFLDVESGIGSHRLRHKASNDVIIGIIDSGIWPESPSFNDTRMGHIPSRWKGTCMEGFDFKKSNCNRKLIGARYYNTQVGSPRDCTGHGTHTSSTAAGSMVSNASYYGLAQGIAKGGSPSSRIAMYKACTIDGCPPSTMLKAIDDAINDGVDIISISVGTRSFLQSRFLSDPLAIGAFHANQRGVLVICSTGNEGPYPSTVVNTAPWIVTVAASSIDRTFRSTIILGNGNMLKGCAINFSNLSRSELYPLVFGRDVATESTPVLEASNCRPGTIDTNKVAGKIIVCVNLDMSVTRNIKKLVAEGAGAKGLILIDDFQKENPFDADVFPFSQVGNDVGAQIFKYMNSTKKPTAVILPSENVKEFKPAPVVAEFSSRGPGELTEGILKPDLMAPGINILAAAIPDTDTSTVPQGKKPSNFIVMSGTSMACPHVAGASAFVKSAHPWWSPSMIRSALMTTATTTNNLGEPLTSNSGATASFHEMGAGEISPLRALSSGLVFETTVQDYLYFLCHYGYKNQAIRFISGTNFTCRYSSPDLISSINYSSISIAKLERKHTTRAIRRTVTNVGPPNSTYNATVDAPNGIKVNVWPDRLAFTKRLMKATYKIIFDAGYASKGYGYGSITWSDGAHTVRTVFAVNVV